MRIRPNARLALALALALSILVTHQAIPSKAASAADSSAFPVRGLAIAAPSSAGLARFVQFVTNDFASRGGNTLILRVDFHYQYESRPDLRAESTLSKADVQHIADSARRHGIRVIPQINLLGHQSWAGTLGNLLRVHPEFDETPWVKMPATYKWPNPDGLYCKSYCPRHPGVHAVVLPLVDELCDAFDADAFHAGLDEVFYLGDDKCPRCQGRNKAELFAGEVKRLRDHLATRKRELWMWGDRLIDGRTTGIGEWEASLNETHPALDLIPKDVVICDWHYDRAEPTAVLFALKGFKVVSCPWRKSEVALHQVQDMVRWRASANATLRPRFLGVLQTVWSGVDSFLQEVDAARAASGNSTNQTAGNCYVRTFDALAAASAR